MATLYDMLAGAQNGSGMEALARQFGLSQQQAQAAVDALLPAFSQGLKRNASDPYGLGGLLSMWAGGQHAQYTDNAAAASSPEGVAAGNDILGQLFGSKDLSRAVASQAAQATGIGQQLLQQMLPVIASMLMGGMARQSADQFQGQAQAGGFGASNPFGEIIEQMMKQGGMPGGMGGARPSPGGNPMGDNPLGKILEGMFGGAAGFPGGQPQRQAAPEPDRQGTDTPKNPPQNPYDEIFGKMFETGRRQQEEYQKGVESIFDQFRRGMDRTR